MASVWHFSEFTFITSTQMAHVETSISDLTARKSRVRHMMEQAAGALVYLGIVATFAFATCIACLFWLLVW
jgi:hypothetical protein